jgi:ZIP family zinc transporter
MLDKDHHAGCDTEIVDSSRDEPRQAVVDIDGGEGGVVPKPAAGDGKQAEVKAEPKDRDLQKMGINTAAAIAIHNFPEGLATFVATLAEPTVGVTLAIAIGIHNIPEGLCVALPIYYATDSRWKGFFWALLSGISEPVGALIGWLIIKSTGDDMNQLVYGILFGIVAGMMIMIVVLELLPTAYRYDPKDRVVTTSVVVGMLVMAASLVIFQF